MGIVYGIIFFLLIYYAAFFLVAQKIEKNSIVDIGWGLGFVLVGWLSALWGTSNPVGTLIVILVTIWGLRLSYHIARRNLGKPEDPRYANMRKNWGRNFPRLQAFFKVFILQGVLLFIIAIPIFATHIYTAPSLNFFGYLGLIIWLIGFFFEAVGDAQLKAFISKPFNKGKLMTKGLWRYTRHPNYFGESAMWWGIFIISLNSVPFYVSLASPVVITVLLLFVSGVPLKENSMKKRPGYKKYARETNKFIPGPPKIQ